MSRIPIVVGEWLIPTKGNSRPRWILAKGPTHVIYGTGGMTHKECLIETMANWATRCRAEPADTETVKEL